MERNTNTHGPDVLGILATLPWDKQVTYMETLYSIAKTAIASNCRNLKVSDLEILTSLEEESDANFEEWLFK